MMSERAWAEKRMKEDFHIGTSFSGALVVTGLIITGFFTFGLTWIPAIGIAISSTAKRREKFYQTNKDKIMKGYKEYCKLHQKRYELKNQGIPSCPHCASVNIEVFTSIKNSYSGRYEYGKPKMVCKLCGYIFEPGQ